MKKLFFILLFLIPGIANAAGIQVSPSKLEAHAGETIQLVVANPTADVLLFEVYPDDFKKVISANPESFTLEAGGRKTVNIQIDKNNKDLLATNISVVSRTLADSKLQTNTGVKIPITIHESQVKTYKKYYIAGSIIILVIIFVSYSLTKKKKRNKETAHENPLP